MSYDRPLLSKDFLRGEKPRDQLFFDPESYVHENQIELILGTAVQQLDVAAKRGHAEYCGQLAGQNMAGAHTPYDLLTYVWSDLFDLHLEFAGDESEHDHVIVRGHVGDLSYFILYLKQHKLTAYFAVNASAKDFPLLQRAIKQHKNLSGKESQLQDPSIPLKSIV